MLEGTIIQASLADNVSCPCLKVKVKVKVRQNKKHGSRHRNVAFQQVCYYLEGRIAFVGRLESCILFAKNNLIS